MMPRISHRGVIYPSRPVDSALWTHFVCNGSVSRAPPTGFERSPLHQHQPRASTPPSPKTRFGRRAPTRQLVPPSWVLTTMTVSSARDLVGLLHPTIGHEVHQVSVSTRRCRGRTGDIPTDASPSRVFPTRAAFSASPRLRAPPPSPTACRWLDLEALLHTSVRCARAPWPVRAHPILSWASLLKPPHRPAPCCPAASPECRREIKRMGPPRRGEVPRDLPLRAPAATHRFSPARAPVYPWPASADAVAGVSSPTPRGERLNLRMSWTMCQHQESRLPPREAEGTQPDGTAQARRLRPRSRHACRAHTRPRSDDLRAVHAAGVRERAPLNS